GRRPRSFRRPPAAGRAGATRGRPRGRRPGRRTSGGRTRWKAGGRSQSSLRLANSRIELRGRGHWGHSATILLCARQKLLHWETPGVICLQGGNASEHAVVHGNPGPKSKRNVHVVTQAETEGDQNRGVNAVQLGLGLRL